MRSPFASAAPFAACLGLLLGGAASAPTPVRAGGCAQMRWAPALAPLPNDELPADGGVLVTLTRSAAGRPERGADPFARVTGRLRQGRRSIPLRIEALGPGLARLVPARAPSPGVWQLVALGERRAVTVVAASAPPSSARPSPAPSLRSVQRLSFEGVGRRGPSRSESVVTQLAAAAPPHSHGLLLYAEGRAILSGVINGTAPTIGLWNTVGRCQTAIPGDAPPAPGRTVTARFVDAWGRVSAPSEPIEVTGG